ncbi:hypothetical protein F5B17DRAFT_387038 [Nemania serpens]|nr:hypothetical protein F5B17DRAFT_387038 [Nemania serpens]
MPSYELFYVATQSCHSMFEMGRAPPPHRLTRALDVIMTRSPQSAFQGLSHARSLALLRFFYPHSLTANAPGKRLSCRFLILYLDSKRPSCLSVHSLSLRSQITTPKTIIPSLFIFQELLTTKKTYDIDIKSNHFQHADLQHAVDALPNDPLPLRSRQGAHVPAPPLVSLHDDVVEVVRRVVAGTHHQLRALPAAVHPGHGGGEEAVQRRADGAGAATHRLLGRPRGADPWLSTLFEKKKITSVAFKHS